MKQTEKASKQVATARLTAAEILYELLFRRKPVKPVFDDYAQKAKISGKDRAFIKEIVYGVLRRKEELEIILGQLSKTPLKKIDPFLCQILKIGLYQILFLEKIPDSAAVNEAVICYRIKKGQKKTHLHGFVNGILRQAVRQKTVLQQQIDSGRAHRPFLNHPQWLTQRWQHNFGTQQTTRICHINNLPPLLTLRVNRKKSGKAEFCQQLDKAAIKWRPARYAPDAILLPDGARINDIPGYQQGFFQVQDQAAQLASLLLGPFQERNLRLLDGCAGVGGKTGHILQLIRSDAALVAVEPEPFRARKLEELQRSCPSSSLQVYQRDLLSLSSKDLALFNRILIDAPCSGTGVIRRHPDIRWNRTENEILQFQKRQLALLRHAATLAKDGAIIVYATCSIEREENEDVITSFLEDHPEFSLSDPSFLLPEITHPMINNRFFSPLPQNQIDGFFAARLIKKRKIIDTP